MQLINCARTRVEVWVDGWPVGTEAKSLHLNDNETGTLDFHANNRNMRIRIWADRPGFRKFLWSSVHGDVEVPVFRTTHKSITYTGDHAIIITSSNTPRLVDWTEAKKSFEARGREVVGREGENPAVDQALEVAKMLVNALATTASALGPAGAGPAGFLVLFAGLIGGPTVQPPQPPNIQEISRVVEEIMTRLTDMEHAQSAALCFSDTAEKFINLMRRSRASLETPGAQDQVSQHLLRDIREMIEDADRLAGPGTLKYSINHMAQNPEKAKYILPQFCEGVVVYLALYRLHLLELNQHGETPETIRITRVDVEEYRNKVAQLRDALIAAYKALEDHAEKESRKHHLIDTLKDNEFRGLVRRSMIGTAHTAEIIALINKLFVVVNHLDLDLASGKFDHFWSYEGLQHQ